MRRTFVARERLVESSDALGKELLAGSRLKEGPRGLRRLGVGDCRVVYEAFDNELVVLAVRVA